MSQTTTPLYLGEWASPDWRNLQGQSAMFADFEMAEADLEGVTVLLAYYSAEGYEGTAVIIFERDGKLWEVYGSHCSCHGLEGQWNPKEVTADELRANLVRNSYELRPIRKQLTALLDARK